MMIPMRKIQIRVRKTKEAPTGFQDAYVEIADKLGVHGVAYGWNITHLQSGYAILKCRKKKMAERIAYALSILPWETITPRNAKKYSKEIVAIVKSTKRGRIPISHETRLAVLKRDSYQCNHCLSTVSLSIDHIRPVFRGGTNSPENLQTLCASCNSRKGHFYRSPRESVIQ